MLAPTSKAVAVNYEVVYGHRAVWVNNPSGCLGRFGVFGIDVHRDIESQVSGQPQCLYCTHERVTADDWRRFKAAMLEFHHVDLSDQPLPLWLE